MSIPDSGPVEAGPTLEQGEPSDAPFDYDPDSPRPGAPPMDVVGGYLLAMQATPLRTAVAREFLTDEASTDWVPERSTLVYGSQSLRGSGAIVNVDLNDIAELNGRGQWLGDTSGGDGITHRLRLVKERGEWRITNPPDALIVPVSYFETRYAQYLLYFFDRSSQVLVPEPVYLPAGEQTPTLLVSGLLEGPDPHPRGLTRTFFPVGTELDDLSVLISNDGTAEVPLTKEILDLDNSQLDMLLAQLGWTLQQIPGIATMSITVDGSPLELPGSGVEQDVHGWPAFDPAVSWASEELFGIRDGKVVALAGDLERRVSGPFGVADNRLRSIGVDLPGEQVAGVTDDGGSALVAPRSREGEAEPGAADPVPVYVGGADLLQPAWDIHGQVWLVDRRRDGARLTVIRSGVPTELAAEGVTGENVQAFLVSRDGTRLVAAVAGGGKDRLMMARIVRRNDGTVQGVSPATRLTTGALNVREIRDLAWRTPDSMALLTGPTPGVPQVVVVSVDGSAALGDVAANTDIIRDRAVEVVTSPALGAPLYVGTRDQRVFELAANGRWTGSDINRGLLSPTFVG